MRTERRFLVAICTITAIIGGLLPPGIVWINEKVINFGIEVARGIRSFKEYIPYLMLFLLLSLLPQIIAMVKQAYIQPTVRLIMRTSVKGKLLCKLKAIKYEHFESEASTEIIDKAYNRAEEASLHLFPKYYMNGITSLIAVIGVLLLFIKVRWWLVITILLPFTLETYLSYKDQFNIYDEMETYWNMERQYGILGRMIKSRESLHESYANHSADYLINEYVSRLNKRNKKYESYYFRYLRKHFLRQNLSKISQIGNALILLFLFFNAQLNIGQLITLTLAVFATLWSELDTCVGIFRWAGHHINTYEYYDKYFLLSESSYGEINIIPADTTIEFKGVCFSYPGTTKLILDKLSFKINMGEKVAIVGENGEGKTTIIKLLLGLFQPSSGEILVGNIPLGNYSQHVREKMFGPVFQDFIQYNLTIGENIGIGDIDNIANEKKIWQAAKQAMLDKTIENFPKGLDTMLGRDFDGGIDLSGGQWQRIAIARAFMGNKPILILDEPTSQLDPLAESKIYTDFTEMIGNKTAILITHRLAAATIADKIIVISNGTVVQEGTHHELAIQQGLYADMYNSQKQWYEKEGVEV